MIGKLLKNDIKSASRSVVYIYFALLISAGAMGISLVTDFGIGKALSSLFLIVIAFCAFLITIFTVFLDYRKTMFGDMGYLTNTLPVTSASLLLSKTLTSLLWVVISFCTLVASIVGVTAYSMEFEGGFDIDLVLQAFPAFGLPTFEVLKSSLFVIAIKLIFMVAVFVMITFFSLTISNVRPFQSLGLLGAIAIFFIVYALISYTGGKLAELINLNVLIFSDATIGFTTDINEALLVQEQGGFYVGLTQVFFQIMLSVVLFIATSELLENKVNIK